MTVAQELLAVTERILGALGEPTMQALLWHMGTEGVSLTPEKFDIIKLDRELKEIFGDGADLFMKEIYIQLRQRIASEASHIDLDERLAPVEKIMKLLELKVSM